MNINDNLVKFKMNNDEIIRSKNRYSNLTYQRDETNMNYPYNGHNQVIKKTYWKIKLQKSFILI